MKRISYVGVDVSAKTLAVIVEQDEERGPVLEFTNDRAGHRKLIALVTKRGRHARVVLEATGNYSLDLGLALHRAKRIEVMVVNPRALSQFAGAFLTRSKTDALDAEVIVEFAKRMPFKAWTPPDPECMDLRAISRRIEAMTKSATQEKNRLHAADAFDEISDVVRNDIQVNVRHLAKRIVRLRDQALTLIDSHRSPLPTHHLNQGHRGRGGDPDPRRDFSAPRRHVGARVGRPRGTGSEDVPVGHLGQQAGPNQSQGEPAHPSGPLHAGNRGCAVRAPRESLLREATGRRKDQDAGERRRDAETAARHLRNVETRSRLRRTQILCDRGLTRNRVSNGSAFSGGRRWL